MALGHGLGHLGDHVQRLRQDDAVVHVVGQVRHRTQIGQDGRPEIGLVDVEHVAARDRVAAETGGVAGFLHFEHGATHVAGVGLDELLDVDAIQRPPAVVAPVERQRRRPMAHVGQRGTRIPHGGSCGRLFSAGVACAQPCHSLCPTQQQRDRVRLEQWAMAFVHGGHFGGMRVGRDLLVQRRSRCDRHLHDGRWHGLPGDAARKQTEPQVVPGCRGQVAVEPAGVRDRLPVPAECAKARIGRVEGGRAGDVSGNHHVVDVLSDDSGRRCDEPARRVGRTRLPQMRHRLADQALTRREGHHPFGRGAREPV